MSDKEKSVHKIQFHPLFNKVFKQVVDIGYNHDESWEITKEMIELNRKLYQLEECLKFLKPLIELWDNEKDEFWNDV